MQTTTVGLFVGLILGLALVLEGFGAMLVVGFAGAVGHLTAKVIDGELDLSEYLAGSESRPPSRRR